MRNFQKTLLSVLAFGAVAGTAFGQSTSGSAYTIKVLGPAWQNQLPCMGIDMYGRVAGTCEYLDQGAIEHRAWTADAVNGYLVSLTENSSINAVSADGFLVGSAYGAPTTFDWLGNQALLFPNAAGSLMAVNTKHDMAGYIFDPANSWTQTAVLFDRFGNQTIIGTPDLVGSAAYGINEAGTVVGYAMDFMGSCNAFLFNGQMSYLTGPFGNSTVAVGINNGWDVYGYTVTPTDQVLPIRWLLSDKPSTYFIPRLPVGYENGVIEAINDKGVGIGTMWTPGGPQRAFMIRKDGTVVDLNTLKPAAGRLYNLVSANAINANGAITGIAEVRIHKDMQPQYVAYVLAPIRPVLGGNNIGW